jgi:excinuclease ABC subunit C
VKKKNLLTVLEKRMLKCAKEEKFEKAQELKDKIFALKHIQEVALMMEDCNLDNIKNVRIEAYDISNISGKFAVGAMVVFDGGKENKSQYRKFKIRSASEPGDVAMMQEVLRRRFNNRWKLPDLIILDGGQGHLNMGKNVLAENDLKISMVGVAKGVNRKKFETIGLADIKRSKLRGILENKKLIKKITDEAHRFAITYHKKLRDRDLIEI